MGNCKGVVNMKKFLSMLLVVSLLLCTIPFMVSAETAEPSSTPTISSSVCSTCLVTMELTTSRTVIDEKTILSTSCPNSPFAEEGHTHIHYYFYISDIYICPMCSRSGEMLTFDHMECQVSRATR